jgi:O-antigen ligase
VVPLPLDNVATIVLPGWVTAAGAAIVFLLLAVRPFAGICALLAFYPLMHQVPRTPVPGLNAETILVSFAMILTLGRSRLRLPPMPLTAVVFALIAVHLMGWLIANTWISIPVETLTAWGRFRSVKSHLFTALLFFVAFWWAREERHRRALLESISAGMAIAALGVCIDFARGGAGRSSGFYDNPNMPAEYLAVFAPICLSLMFRPDLPRSRRALHAICYGAAMMAVLFTLSRTGWLAVIFGHGVYLGLLHPRVLVTAAFALLLLGPAAYPLLPQRVHDRIEGTFQTGTVVYRTGVDVSLESSASSRLAQYRAGLDMFLASPLWGHGSESYRLLSVEYGARYGIVTSIAPHGTLIKAAAETGLIGLLALFWLAALVLRIGWQSWTRTSAAERAHGALLLSVGVASIIANLFGSSFLGSWLYSSALWAIFGTLAAQGSSVVVRGESRQRAPEPRWRRNAQLARAPGLPG